MTSPHEFEIETHSGRFVDTSNPDPVTILLSDIAHALSLTCRYGGHCRVFYSVAEHAVFVSKRLERKGYGRLAQLRGLHHDDAESYLGDIPRPMKPLLGDTYETLSDRMDVAIVTALELPFDAESFHDPLVKDADNFALAVEARYLLNSQGKGWLNGEQGAHKWDMDLPSRIVTPDYWCGGLSPTNAKQLYLRRHRELTKERTTT